MKLYRLSGATFYDCIYTIYQFSKSLLENEMSILRTMAPSMFNLTHLAWPVVVQLFVFIYSGIQ